MRRHSSPVPPDLAVVGVDVAKRTFVSVRLEGDGSWSKARSYTNDRAGFEAFVAAQGVGAARFVVAFEPTGHYGERLLQWLTTLEIPVFQVQPVHTKRAKELYDGTRRKTDAKDARVIAELCRRGIAKPYRPLTGPFAELRVLARHREGLVKRRSQLLQRLHHRLDVVFPELLDHFYKLNSSACLALLRRAPTPATLLAERPATLTRTLRQASKGQIGTDTTRALLEAARTTSGIVHGVEAHALGIRQGAEELQRLAVDIATVETRMRSELTEVDYAANLLTIPHLGEITLAILLGEFGDLRNYRVARQLVAMAGLDLIEQSSGERQGRRHISRRGRRYARQVLYLAVLRLGWTSLAEPRRRLVEDNKVAPTKAAVANMCRLLRILHAMVRDGVPFDASRFTAPVSGGCAA